MNPQEMTLDQCRDWLAERAGWTKPTSADPYWSKCGEQPKVLHADDHPIPATLEEVSWLPKGWDYMGISYDLNKEPYRRWCSQVFGREQITIEADTELLARFRLRVACEMEVKP